MSLEPPKIPGRGALQALNFFMADMQAGVGPFLGVFLLAHGWQSGWIGSVMTIGGVVGMIMTAPAGAWVDASHRKRWLVAVLLADHALSGRDRDCGRGDRARRRRNHAWDVWAEGIQPTKRSQPSL